MEDSFKSPTRQYEYVVMSFGLTSAPTVFQASVKDVLQYVLNHFVFVYLHVFRLHGLFVEVVPDQSVLFSSAA